MRRLIAGLLAHIRRRRWTVVAPVGLAGVIAGGAIVGVDSAPSSNRQGQQQLVIPLDSSTPSDAPSPIDSPTPSPIGSPTPSLSLSPTPAGALMYHGRAVDEAGKPIAGLYVYLTNPVTGEGSVTTGLPEELGRTRADGTFDEACPPSDVPIALVAFEAGAVPPIYDASRNYAWRDAAGTGSANPLCSSDTNAPPVTSVM